MRKDYQGECTPEEIAKITEENKKQYTKVTAVLWSLTTVVWTVLFVLDCLNDAAILQFILHGFCMVANGVVAVVHILRARRIKREETARDTETDPLDSATK